MARLDCRNLQIAWFHSGAQKYAAHVVYQEIFGEEPDTVQTNKAPSQTSPFLSQALGQTSAGDGIVKVTPGRVDVFLQAPEINHGSKIAFPTLDAIESFEVFKVALENKGVAFDDCYRQAVICNFLTEFPNRAEANRSLFDTCRIDGNAPDAIDLIHQFNSRKELREGFLLNRLIRHSVEHMQLFQVPTPQGVDQASLKIDLDQHFPAHEVFAHFQTYDFNNHPQGEKFSKAQQTVNVMEIFAEILKVKKGVML
ncbi:hypothetical protein [Oceaniovalibus sp. ACAM 378]|uniref:hypothetical protein n=1 Tax=Oceaniovalibus sp. ACAM 378 TaxID=2599923 RepID=UPI0011DBF0AF|nr:hypothetical protein [Oceaniovalibus sp. ACAM 378]TYB89030.1 hypothetical protein FQ320_08875 [Oceaniovalibus sp. ACAM 378]